MKRVLIITHSFPPLLEARAIQIAKLVRHLPNTGWQPTVLTVDPDKTPIGQDATLKRLLPNDLKIIHTPAFEPQWAISILARLMPSLLYIPDKQIGWYPYAIKTAQRLIEQESFDLVFTNAKPFTCHLIGLVLRKKYPIPWAAYFSDPWVDNPYFAHINTWQVKRNRQQETAVLKIADGLIFNNIETVRLMLGAQGEQDPRVQILPHCYDPDLFAMSAPPSTSPIKRIVHTGNFYGIRSPLPLLRALKKAQDRLPPHEVLLVGKIDPQHQKAIREEGLTDTLKLIDSVPYLESLSYIQMADLLVTIDAPTEEPSVFFPSKLVDYLGAAKPILGITPPNSTTHRILSDHGHCVADVTNIDHIAQQLIVCLSQSPSAHTAPETYNAIHVAHTLSDFFDHLCATRKTPCTS